MALGKDDGFAYPEGHRFFKEGPVKATFPPEKLSEKKPDLYLEGFHRTGQWVKICKLEPREDIKEMMRSINSKRQPFWTKVNIDFDAFDAWRVTPYHEYKWLF